MNVEDALWERQIPRPVLALVHLLALAPKDGATYDALAFGLGVQTFQIRKVVMEAQSLGFVSVDYPSHREKAIVTLCEKGREVHRILFQNRG